MHAMPSQTTRPDHPLIARLTAIIACLLLMVALGSESALAQDDAEAGGDEPTAKSVEGDEAAEETDEEAEEVGAEVIAATSDKSWGAFFGRTHVLFLHLPIGLIIGAFAIEVLGVFRRSRGYDIAAAWLFVFGAASSVLAVATGLLLGTEWAADSAQAGKAPDSVWALLFADTIEEGVSETLGWHMWLGITLMFAAILAAVLKVMAVRRQWQDDPPVAQVGGWPLMLSRLGMIGCMAALPFVGHLGGNMTHTPEFLVERAPFDVPDKFVYWPEPIEPQTIDDDPDPNLPDVQLVNGSVAFWNAKIQPTLDVHCTACHNATKQNGGLRLDSLKWAVEGNVIEPEDAEFSELYRRVALPPSHDEFMPTNIKKYGMMSQQQVHMLGDWLQKFNGELDDGSIAAATDPSDKVKEKAPAPKPEPAKPLIDPKAVNAITAAGGTAQSLSQEEDPDLLTVKFAYLKALDPASVATLAPTADQVAWLSFEGTPVTDEAAGALPELPALTKLNLKDTGLTDAGLAALPDMPELKWLNLFGTAITDKGADALKRYTALEKLYLTGTAVSADAVDTLRKALPDAEVFSDHDGIFEFGPAEPAATDGKEEGTQDAAPKPDQASAKPINDKCPVSGAPVNAGFVSTYKDKTVGFCCNNCKGKFDKDPEPFASKLPE